MSGEESLPPPVPPPRPVSVRVGPPPPPSHAQQPELKSPIWLLKPKVSCNDTTARYLNEPGSIDNPFVFEDTTFTDIKIEAGDVYIQFRRCRFVRAMIEGADDIKRIQRIDCKTEGSPSESALVVRPIGSVDTPLHFKKIDFAHLDLSFPQVHAVMEDCSFIQCNFDGFQNVDTHHCVYYSNPTQFDAGRLAFKVMFGTEPMYGYVEPKEYIVVVETKKEKWWERWKGKVAHTLLAINNPPVVV